MSTSTPLGYIFTAPEAVRANIVARIESHVLDEVKDMLANDEIQIQMGFEDTDPRDFEEMFLKYVEGYLSIFIK